MARTPHKNRIELLQGTLDMLILRTLQWGPQHGHGVKVAIRASSDGVLRVDHGSLYPALHRLEARGYVDGEWGVSEKNRRARYYSITRSGRQHLASETEKLMSYADTITTLLASAKVAR